MPGFSAGMHNVSRDEQRHIGFGVKVLSDCFAETEECKAAVVELLREILPVSTRRVHAARTGTSSTPAATASRWRTSTPSACGRWSRSGRPTGYPDHRDAARRLPVRPDHLARGAGGAGDQAAEGGRRRRAGRRPRLLARGAGPAVRHHRPLGRHRRGERQAADDPVAVQRRRARGTSSSTTARPAPFRARRRRRRHARDELAGLARGLELGRRPACARCCAARSARAAIPCAFLRMQKLFPRAPRRH